jgi:selenocysteine lyase/cysteine desulfurase
MWLNWACLGERSAADGNDDMAAASASLKRALRTTIEWTAAWMQCSPQHIILTSGTTEACDVILRNARVPQPEVILHSSYAHPTVRESVRRAAKYLTAVGARQVSAIEVDLASNETSPDVLAAEVAQRVTAAAAGRPALLILEHVTTFGDRLPVDEIEVCLAETAPRITLVWDGAQAVGLWRPKHSSRADYIGCFHKYVDGPVGTGFAVIRNADLDLLPHRVAARQYDLLDCEAELLPSDEIHKWLACATALGELVDDDGGRLRKVAKLRELLLRELPPRILGNASDSTRSHIVTIDLLSPSIATLVWRRIEAQGFRTKLDGARIRISLHHSQSENEVSVFAKQLKSEIDLTASE